MEIRFMMHIKPARIKLLFLCTGNSCRSQMAECWTRHLKGNMIDVWSAGVETHGLDPLATKVMAEAGVDISNHQSTHVKDVLDIPFDYVITVCDHARESCPLFPRPVSRRFTKALMIRLSWRNPRNPKKRCLIFTDACVMKLKFLWKHCRTA
jgi:protein-tyrosine-phosphatase